jgi:transposase-like protein
MFGDDAKALQFLRSAWPTAAVCPYCGGTEIGESSNADPRDHGALTCTSCGRPFSVWRGSALEGRAVPLHKWLQAIFLTDGGIRPIRAVHIERIVGVPGPTAAAMLRSMKDDQTFRRLFAAMQALAL